MLKEIKISEIKIGDRYRKDVGDLYRSIAMTDNMPD